MVSRVLLQSERINTYAQVVIRTALRIRKTTGGCGDLGAPQLVSFG
jgi:hypothetical protein